MAIIAMFNWGIRELISVFETVTRWWTIIYVLILAVCSVPAVLVAIFFSGPDNWVWGMFLYLCVIYAMTYVPLFYFQRSVAKELDYYESDTQREKPERPSVLTLVAVVTLSPLVIFMMIAVVKGSRLGFALPLLQCELSLNGNSLREYWRKVNAEETDLYHIDNLELASVQVGLVAVSTVPLLYYAFVWASTSLIWLSPFMLALAEILITTALVKAFITEFTEQSADAQLDGQGHASSMSEKINTTALKLKGIALGVASLLWYWSLVSIFISHNGTIVEFFRQIIMFDLISLVFVGSCGFFLLRSVANRPIRKTIQNPDSDLTDAIRGEIVELSGTVVAADSTDPSLFGHKAPLVGNWEIEEAVNLDGETRWRTVESGQRTDAFSIRSDNGREATIDDDSIFSTEGTLKRLTNETQEMVVRPTEEIPTECESFLTQENIDVTEARNKGPSIQPVEGTTGALKFTEANYLKDGEDLFIRGRMESRGRVGPGEISFDTDELCVIMNRKRHNYLSYQFIALYAAAVFAVCTMLLWVLEAALSSGLV